MKLVTGAVDVGKRLDSFIFEHVPETVSRGVVQKQIKNGEVKVDKKKIAKVSFPLQENMTVVVHIEEPKDENPLPRAEDIPLTILFENDDFLVISKPPFMCTHPDEHHTTGTVVNAIMGYLKNHHTQFSEEDLQRPGIVHRLDKDTSGCLMVAKNPEMQRYLSKIIAERKVTKKYIALVLGRLPTIKGTIDSPLVRDPQNREKMTTMRSNKSREALTHFEVDQEFRFPSCTAVEVHIITGRTHQIRAHFSAIGHPVYGDDLYGNPKENDIFCTKYGMKRMFLHAKTLQIPLPDGTEIHVEAPLPDDLQKVLDQMEV